MRSLKSNIELYKGKFGFYIKCNNKNYSLPKNYSNPENISLNDAINNRKKLNHKLDIHFFNDIKISMAKPSSIKIRLNSTAKTGFFYVTKRIIKP